MNLAYYIAKRYLFSPKSQNAVNVITAISVIGVAVGTIALVVVLSVFNGFESLIKSQYNQLNPDFVVQSKHSKVFSIQNLEVDVLSNLSNWESVQEVLEEKVLLRNDDEEQIARIKGVSIWNQSDSLSIEKYIFKGSSFRQYPEDNWVVIGQSIAQVLSVSVEPLNNRLHVFVPNLRAKSLSVSEKPFVEEVFYVSGIYSVRAEYDANYVIANLSDVQQFLQKEDKLSALEFNVSDDEDVEKVQVLLQDFFGDAFVVKNRFQQQEFLYKVLQTEKWAIFFILAFILLIATFNIVASIIMIVLEKRKDISSLWAIGAPEKTIQQIFFYEGLLITSLGGGLGLVLGVGLCLVQQQYGIIQLGEQGAFIVNAYPVELQWLDVALIMATVLCVGVLLTYFPVKLLKKNFIQTTS